MADELEIIGRAQHGDRQALEELLIAHQSACYGFALRLTRNAADAEDVCQDAFVRAARDIAAWKPSGSFRSWLLKIVLNAHQNRRQAESTRQQRERRFGMAQPTQAHDDRAEKSELKEQLEIALKELDDSFRLPISLHYEQGLTRTEVAEVLNIPEGTVATHIRRGVERLRELLTNAGYASAEAAVIAALSGGSAISVPAGMAATIHGIVTGGSAKGAIATGAVAAGKMKLTAAVLGAAVIAAVLIIAAPKFNSRPSVPTQPVAAAGPMAETKDEPKPKPLLPYPITTISGTVVENKKKKPVPGITVVVQNEGDVLMLPVPGDRTEDNLPSAVSDEQGRYSVRFMTDVRTQVTVTVTAKMNTFGSGVLQFGVYQGESFTASPMIMQTYWSVRGRVVDQDGKPVAGAIVNGRGPSNDMTTDKDGYFTDTKVLEHRFPVGVAAQGYEFKWIWIDDNAGEPVIKLRPCKPVTGTVLEADGSPAKDVRVYAGTHPSRWKSPYWSVPVDDNGRFTLGSVAENGEPTYIFPGRNMIALGDGVKVDAGQSNVALRLTARGQVEILAKDIDGKPLQRVNVSSIQNNEPFSRFSRSGRTDELGRVVMTDVPIGPTHVTLASLSQLYSSNQLHVLPSIDVNVEAGKKASATLARKPDGKSITGYLLDEKNQPVLHAWFYVLMKRAEPDVDGGIPEVYLGRGYTEVDGRFNVSMERAGGVPESPQLFETSMPEKEKVRICVSHQGYRWVMDQTLDWPKDANRLDVKKLVLKLLPERVITVKRESPKLEWTSVAGCTDEAGKNVPFRNIDDQITEQGTQRIAVRYQGALKLRVQGNAQAVVIPVPAGDDPVIARFSGSEPQPVAPPKVIHTNGEF